MPTTRHRAALWMIGFALSLCAMAMAVRTLADQLGVFQILFLRGGLGLPVILLALLVVQGPGGLAQLRSRHLPLHALRNLMHLAAQGFWVVALGVLPLATVFAVEFSAPVWAVILAVVLFAERPALRQWLGVGIGVLGVLLVARPWEGAISWGLLAAVLAALGYAGNHLATRALSRHDSTWAVLVWMALIQTPLALAAALGDWRPIEPGHWPAILVVAASSLVAHLCLTNAYRLAPVAEVVVFDYLRLPLIAVAATLVFGDPLDPMALIGGAVVIAGVIVTQRRPAT